jgi:hypothetical protein
MNPLKDTPKRVIEKLLAWGGKNPHGLPNWRIILAENHLVQRAGTWTSFESDDKQADFQHMRTEAGEHACTFQTQSISPTEVKIGMFWVPKWPVKGWILERWFPTSSFGTKREWEAAKSSDGVTPMMGPYPEKGDYFLLDGPWAEIPNLEDVRKAVSTWENDTSHTHGRIDDDKVAEAAAATMREEEEREAQQYDVLLREVDYGRKQTIDFIKANPTLSGFYNRAANQTVNLNR